MMKQAMSGFVRALGVPALLLAAAASAGAQEGAADAEIPREAAPVPLEAPQIDGRYEDWEAVPVLFDFFEAYAPPSFRRESYVGGVELLPIDAARHWEQGGSALSEVKILRGPNGVYLYAALRPPIQPGLSLFIYLHGESEGAGADEPNDLTLELVPADGAEPGMVVLWQREAQPSEAQRSEAESNDGAPAIVGDLVAGTHFLEASVDWARLPPTLRARPPAVSFIDLTTVYFDRVELAYEEFYWASSPVEDMPTVGSVQASP